MNILNIERVGYFDRVFIDGNLKALGKSHGVTIENNESLAESIENDSEGYTHNIAKLKLQLIGESEIETDDNEREHINKSREEDGIKLIDKCNNIERYLIAYMKVLIIKGDYVFPFKNKASVTHEFDIKDTNENIEYWENYNAARNLALEIADTHGIKITTVNMAIIDKIYVYKAFRNNGIAKWLHNNIKDLIRVYGLIQTHGLVLAYGDFTKQSSRDNRYTEFLKEHYKNNGYYEIDSRRKEKWQTKNDNIMYKVIV